MACGGGPCAYITLIRHGETLANHMRLLQGHSDSPLTVHGTSQIEALGRYWGARQKGEQCPSDGGPSQTLEPPITLLVASPVGRANKTADAIARNCIDLDVHASDIKMSNDDADLPTASRSSFDPDFEAALLQEIGKATLDPASLSYCLDAGLAERDFGYMESTRGGIYVPYQQSSGNISNGAVYNKRGKGNGETKAVFEQRVKNVGRRWIQLASKAAVLSGDSGKPSVASSRGTDRSATAGPVHVVLVTHGLWLKTFLALFLGANTQPPFAANTGFFTLELRAPRLFFRMEKGSILESSREVHNRDKSSTVTRREVARAEPNAARPDRISLLPGLQLISKDQTPHLAGVKRQCGGAGSIAEDRSQSKLQSFFGSSPSKKRKEVSPD
ncbi:phosphoglycerate mutase-like protein [Tilletiaria anomala UBC 951]|uniref:Phosphoglycerate mutase-like protein n=1 Tax=Tilletiaria anomala (strain ATCC 24038 / CBS 436.72 / UBC 951) TaxID=1037660 RepID=A0A066WP44_TILAU|nr:phosphoglycerate mutase-like protein [Tilletiaria anomala UBC 951]KDN52360.1 phosphoglycerate mutase-like protein [Tilletiaria anomala UBC 951]